MGSIRVIWAVQDKISLDADEEKAIELKRERVGGQERVLWNLALSIPPQEFDLTDAELARIRAAVGAWPGYGVAADRRWPEPILRAFTEFEPARPESMVDEGMHRL